MPKHYCTQRAEWRLLRGQPAQHLSVHYQLGCDYQTALITIYNQGDPVFLCESHASAFGQSNDAPIAGVRLIGSQAAESSNPPKNDDRTQTLESAVAKPRASAVLDTGGSPAATKVRREVIHPFFRAPARDLTYGNPAKALVDETIWNMATGDYEVYRTALLDGKTAAEAAQAAGGQLAIVHRKIGEYTLKIESVLSESKATINVAGVIDHPLEHAMLEIISNSAMSEAEKDAAVDHLGALQQRINRGLNREIAPLQAHRIARTIGDSANWGAGSSLSEALKPAYRAVYASIRKAIGAAVPEARDLDERLSNLCAAKSDLENMATANASQCLPIGAS